MASKLPRGSEKTPVSLTSLLPFSLLPLLSIDERSNAIENPYVSFRSVSHESYVYTKIGS